MTMKEPLPETGGFINPERFEDEVEAFDEPASPKLLDDARELHSQPWSPMVSGMAEIEYVTFDGEDGADKYALNAARDQAVLAIVEKYQDRPEVHRHELRYRESSLTNKDTSDSTRLYMREIGQYRLLKAKDEQALFARIETGLAVYRQLGGDSLPDDLSQEQEEAMIDLTAAYKIVYNSNLRLVVSVAQGIKIPNTSLIEKTQYGNSGLSTAIRRFDITSGNKFSTFAISWIKQSIRKGSIDNYRTVRAPIDLYYEWRQVRQATASLEQRLKRQPTDEEVAAACSMETAEVEHVNQSFKSIDSLNRPTGEAETELGELLPDPYTIESEIETIGQKSLVAGIFEEAGLTATEQTILSLRYGVFVESLKDVPVSTKKRGYVYSEIMSEHGREDGHTLEEVGQVFGVTRERIRQVEKRALEKMRGSALQAHLSINN